MEWHHERAAAIPAEHVLAEHVPAEHVPAQHANPNLSRIGVVVYGDGLLADALITQSASNLVASGCRVGGIVQSNSRRPGRRRCDMFVRDLLGGHEIKISLDRGNEARGCRLDPGAFARIDAWIERAVLERVDLLVINKFGREEAHGRGLRPVIAEALIAEIPLLIGVSTRNLGDFLTFIEAPATHLSPEIESITAWCRNAIERGAQDQYQTRPLSVQA